MPNMPQITEFTESQIEALHSCPWCHSQSTEYLFSESGFPYVQCRNCTLIYLQKRVREENLEMVYTDSYHVAADGAWVRRTAEKRLNLFGKLPPRARIHEDGAGTGAFVAVCRSRGFECTGNDLGIGSIQIANEMFGVDLVHGPVEAVGIEPRSIDAFACFNLLSHVYCPWEYLANISKLLAPTGVLLLRTGDRSGHFRNLRWGNWSAPEHVFHYTDSVLKGMASAANLIIERTIPAFDSDYPYFLHNYSNTPGSSLSKKLARRVSSYSVLIWNLLKLPKDDVFVMARRK
jgi:SAM-dependent methyltransferase